MSALAHVLEAAGLATVAIGLVRGQAVRGRAPRMLVCDFPLGRPLGRPGDAAFQHQVLGAMLGLLDRTDVPVLEDFPERIVDQADHPLACTLPPRHDPRLHPAVDEALGLRPAYDRTWARTGRTGVARLGGPDRIPALVDAFVALGAGADPEHLEVPVRELGSAALDVRAYYEEAALSLADHVPGAREAEAWFYGSTQTGAVLRLARRQLRDAGVSRGVWFAFVPTGHER